MKKIGLLIVLAITIINCDGQKSKNITGENSVTENVSIRKEHSNPDVKFKVNKTFDKKGNLISYDSVYTYEYTYPNGKKQEYESDSVIKDFQNSISEDFVPKLNNSYYIDLFPNDSEDVIHFHEKDYFLKQFRNESARFEKMMIELDSLRMSFLKENYLGDNSHEKEKNKMN